MRWQRLFADLEAQLAVEGRALDDERVGDLTRAELAGVALVDRLRAAVATPVRVYVRSGEVLAGRLCDLGAAWLLLDDGRERLVPLAAVVATESVDRARRAVSAASQVETRLGLGHALRALCRDRARVALAAGPLDVVGVIDAVGADHIELALLGADGLRPSGRRLHLPFAALDHLTRIG